MHPFYFSQGGTSGSFGSLRCPRRDKSSLKTLFNTLVCLGIILLSCKGVVLYKLDLTSFVFSRKKSHPLGLKYKFCLHKSW